MILQPSDCDRLVAALPDNAQTVLPLHFILVGRAEAYVDSPDNPRNMAVRTDTVNSMVFADGEDMQILEGLLGEAGPAGMTWFPDRLAPHVQALTDSAYGTVLRRAEHLQRSTSTAPPIPATPGFEVRRLTADDLHLAQGAPERIQWVTHGWGDWQRLLTDGIVVAALAGSNVAALAVTFGMSRQYADIAVATAPAFQNRGLCTACAATLMPQIMQTGRRPVWTVDVSNKPSCRVSDKLGFETHFRAVSFSRDS